MRRVIYYFVIVLLLAQFARLLFVGYRIGRKDLAFALVGDLADYAAAHQLCLPNDWRSFVDWYTETYRKERWREPDLAGRFSVEWGANIKCVVSNQMNVIYVMDPNLQHLERALNDTFRRYVAGLIPTSESAPQQ